RLASPNVAQMLESIVAVAGDNRPRFKPLSRQAAALRAARMCYDHIAGRLGVGLADTLQTRGHIVITDETGEITEPGVRFLREFGVDLDTAQRRKRIFCRACLDWSERRTHIGGAVGAALAGRCEQLGWTARMRNSRALTITPSGRRGLNEVFGLAF
ncbi:MAG TPA: transcriptional regulator, partial [Alphaproteobacteria bacterium]